MRRKNPKIKASVMKGQAHELTKSPQVVVDEAPVANRRYSRLPVGATSVAPIVNRLYRGLLVRLAATLAMALPPVHELAINTLAQFLPLV